MQDTNLTTPSHSRPLFYQNWWLDTVCAHGKWQRVTASYKNTFTAEFVLFEKSKYSFSYATQPPYTPYSGLFFFPSHEVMDYPSLGAAESMVTEILKQIDEPQLLTCNLHPSITNHFPFHLLGFSQTTRYTYIIPYHSEDIILSKMKPQLRNILKNKYNEKLVERNTPSSDLLTLLKNHFQNRQIQKFFHPDIIESLITQGLSRHCCHTYGFRNNEGILTSAVITFSDASSHYCVFTASAESAGSEEVSFLLWTAIKDAIATKKSFDFEGSMIPGVEKFYRSFGGDQIPYHQITKSRGFLAKLYTLIFR